MNVKMTKTENDGRKDVRGRDLPAYVVLVDGEEVGMVWKLQRQHDVLSGRIKTGSTYSYGWGWSDKVRVAFPSIPYRKGFGGYSSQPLPKKSREQAVEALVASLSVQSSN